MPGISLQSHMDAKHSVNMRNPDWCLVLELLLKGGQTVRMASPYLCQN